MMSVGDIEAQIIATTGLFASQTAAGAPADQQLAVQAGTHARFLTTIRNLPSIDVTGATRLNNAVAGSPFTQDQKNAMLIAITNKQLEHVLGYITIHHRLVMYPKSC